MVAMKFYSVLKIHNRQPLRPIVSSRGSIKYGVAMELANIICHSVGQSPNHLKKTQHFIQHIKEVELEPGEVMASYGPLHQHIVKQKLQQDPLFLQRTNMSIPQIVTLLEFCLKNTYFLLQGKYYEQVHGAAMGSPIIPLLQTCSRRSLK